MSIVWHSFSLGFRTIPPLWVINRSNGHIESSAVVVMGTTNMCTKCYGHQSNSYWDISVWSKWGMLHVCPEQHHGANLALFTVYRHSNNDPRYSVSISCSSVGTPVYRGGSMSGHLVHHPAWALIKFSLHERNERTVKWCRGSNACVLLTQAHSLCPCVSADLSTWRQAVWLLKQATFLPHLLISVLITTQQTKQNKVVCTLLRSFAASTQHTTCIYKPYIHDGLMGHVWQLMHFQSQHQNTQ